MLNHAGLTNAVPDDVKRSGGSGRIRRALALSNFSCELAAEYASSSLYLLLFHCPPGIQAHLHQTRPPQRQIRGSGLAGVHDYNLGDVERFGVGTANPRHVYYLKNPCCINLVRITRGEEKRAAEGDDASDKAREDLWLVELVTEE